MSNLEEYSENESFQDAVSYSSSSSSLSLASLQNQQNQVVGFGSGEQVDLVNGMEELKDLKPDSVSGSKAEQDLSISEIQQTVELSPTIPSKDFKYRFNQKSIFNSDLLPPTRVISLASIELAEIDIEELLIEIEEEAARQLQSKRQLQIKKSKLGKRTGRQSTSRNASIDWIGFFEEESPELPLKPFNSKPAAIFPSRTTAAPFPSRPVTTTRSRSTSPSSTRPSPLALGNNNQRIPLSPILSSPLSASFAKENIYSQVDDSVSPTITTPISSPPLSNSMNFSPSTTSAHSINSRNSTSSSISGRGKRWSTSTFASTNPSSIGDWNPTGDRLRSNSTTSSLDPSKISALHGMTFPKTTKNLGSNHIFTPKSPRGASSAMSPSSSSSSIMSKRREGVNFTMIEEGKEIKDEISDWNGFLNGDFVAALPSPTVPFKLEDSTEEVKRREEFNALTPRKGQIYESSVFNESTASINSKKSLRGGILKTIKRLKRSTAVASDV